MQQTNSQQENANISFNIELDVLSGNYAEGIQKFYVEANKDRLASYKTLVGERGKINGSWVTITDVEASPDNRHMTVTAQ